MQITNRDGTVVSKSSCQSDRNYIRNIFYCAQFTINLADNQAPYHWQKC